MSKINKIHHFKITVVGGGLTGILMIKLLLKKKVVDSRDLCWINPVKKGLYDNRVSFINLKNFNALKNILNIKLSLNDYSIIKKIEIHNHGQKLPLTLSDKKSHGIIINNNKIKELLSFDTSNLTEIRSIVTNTNVNEFKRNLSLKNGNIISSDLVLAADGNSSQLRNLSKINFFSKKLSHSIVNGYIKCADDSLNTARQVFLRNNFVGLLPTAPKENFTSFVWSLDNNQLNKYLNNDKLITKLINLLNNQFKNTNTKFHKIESKKINSSINLNVYPIDIKYVPKPFNKRIVLLGDAAHSIHPLAGQGFNLSIEDCVVMVSNLLEARTVGKDLGDKSIILDYIKKRKIRKDFITFSTTSLYFIFKNNYPLLNKFINYGIEKLEKTHFKNLFKFLARGL